MVGFYKHDIPAWMDGTEALSDGAYRAYHVIIQLIMLNEGPIARNERGIAGRCNQPMRAFGKHLKELLDAGKLFIDEAGRIANERAANELETVKNNRVNAGKGGKISGNLRKTSGKTAETFGFPAETSEFFEDGSAKSLKNNDSGRAALQESRSLKEKRREEKIREEGEESSASASEQDDEVLPWEAIKAAAQPKPEPEAQPEPGPADVFFKNGVVVFTEPEFEGLKATYRSLKFPRDLLAVCPWVNRRFSENRRAGKPEAWQDILGTMLAKNDKAAEREASAIKARAEAEAAAQAKAGAAPPKRKLI